MALLGRVTQLTGEVLYGNPGVSPSGRVTQLVGEVMFKPEPRVETWATRLLVATSTRAPKTVVNNPMFMS